MNLYFSPLACSLATRIALYEAGAQARYTPVDLRHKRLPDGSDFLAVNPMGQVPALAVDGGEILTENSAVLQYVAQQFPESNLAPAEGAERMRLLKWLGFIATEIHKASFGPLFDPASTEEVKAYARSKIPQRFGVLDRHLSSRDYLLDSFSIADAYLATVLNWTAGVNVDLKAWPALHAYHRRVLQRPAVAKAFGEELEMYREEQARQKQG